MVDSMVALVLDGILMKCAPVTVKTRIGFKCAPIVVKPNPRIKCAQLNVTPTQHV